MSINVAESTRRNGIESVAPQTGQTSVARLAVVCDYREENWPSMELVAEMLLEGLQRNYGETIQATRLRLPLRRRFSRDGATAGVLFNSDRLLNRFRDYPRWLRRKRTEFDLFHLVDHSYAQLVHQLPAERTIVTCHDVDTFRSILKGTGERRTLFFRGMVRRIASGLQKAARVACVSAATRDQLLAHELVAPERVVVVPNGVHPSCSPAGDASADREAARMLGEASADPDASLILHVGSTIWRKRIDVLLKVFAALREEFPRARLVRVGGEFTTSQSTLVERLGLGGAIVVLPRLERDVLAAVYRRAAIVLQPSEREGFGLPVVEALACGTPVVASNLASLREVGGDAVAYCPVADLSSWTETVLRLLWERREQPRQWDERRAAGLRRAAGFSWAAYAERMAALYQEVLRESCWSPKISGGR
jgi:glycosyltransferase involved in cell wall biosynthesis